MTALKIKSFCTMVATVFLSSCTFQHDAKNIVSPLEIYPEQTYKREANQVDIKADVYVASKNAIKVKAVEVFLRQFGIYVEKVIPLDAPSQIAPQPIGLASAKLGVKNRIASVEKIKSPKRPYVVVAVENFFTEEGISTPIDFALVEIKIVFTGKIFTVDFISDGVVADPEIFAAAKASGIHETNTGFNITLGEIMAKQYSWDKANWMPHVTNGKMNRFDQILSAINYSVR